MLWLPADGSGGRFCFICRHFSAPSSPPPPVSPFAVFLHHQLTLDHCYGCSLSLSLSLVPALEIITEKVGVSEDVAGATFMAAGGSAPELFTSFIGTFISKSDVGLGTIVGSAVFNVLFVIGMCAIFSKELLHLTWWPLARDCTFYTVYLVMLAAFFANKEITMVEAIILFLGYLGYVLFMKYNAKIEFWVKHQLARLRRLRNREKKIEDLRRRGEDVPPEEVLDQQEQDEQEAEDITTAQAIYMRKATILKVRRITFHAGTLSLMFKEVDPIGKGPEAGKSKRFKRAVQMVIFRIREHKAMIEQQQKLATQHMDQKTVGMEKYLLTRQLSIPQLRTAVLDPAYYEHHHPDDAKSSASTRPSIVDAHSASESMSDTNLEMTSLASKNGPPSDAGNVASGDDDDKNHSDTENSRRESVLSGPRHSNPRLSVEAVASSGTDSQERVGTIGIRSADDGFGDGDNDDDGDVDATGGRALEWPKTTGRQIMYVILIPITFLLYYTLPDVTTKKWRNWYPWTFLGSILWIGFYSYFMVWWATLAGIIMGIPTEVLGVTVLAAGTSVPDLLTSVIVARNGFGDMAVSSSIGSNIFDVTVGLPVPWFFYTAIKGKAIEVGSDGLFLSVILLLIMLVGVITTVAYNKWNMTRSLGITMFVMYGLFILQHLLIEYEVVDV
jgi:solute carrier family 24 (sodium/potassium/calcium exchanger), member 1